MAGIACLAGPGAAVASRPSAVLVFAPVNERSLAALPGMSVGILSAAEGSPSSTQLELDITQGARLASGAYASPPSPLELLTRRAGGAIAGWARARARARAAPGELVPGLLASRLGGAAYVASAGHSSDAAVAADTDGHVAAVSLGEPATLAARVRELGAHWPLVVVTGPPGRPGRDAVRRLDASRGPRELLIVVQSDPASRPSRLLWIGAAGLGATGPGAAGLDAAGLDDGSAGELTSSDTQERGLLASTDIAPTILAHEHLPTPASVQGKHVRVEGHLDGPALRSTMARLEVIGSRRLPALGWLLLAWVLMVACTRTRQGRRRALRIGALGVLWAPVVALLTAALAPAAVVEYLLLAVLCPTLGALCDRLLAWPRALLAPALA
ncbi:MAG TPA: hypothetical protein VLZ06_12895, partial [Solirubrobacteraceae bacterium]|nr:hypothetical protein [Solirubrobacteraceae bacterium]